MRSKSTEYTSTESLITTLVDDARPVRRLSPPHARLLAWLALSLPAVAIVVWLFGLRPDLGAQLQDSRFLFEVAAALMTAIFAATAAFCSVVPGRPRYELFMPLVPLALWLALLGRGCWQDWVSLGPAGLALHIDFMCFPGIALVGLAPGILMGWLLHRGHVFDPPVTAGLGILAVAALGAAGRRLFHEHDTGIMVLVWQFGTVALFAAGSMALASLHRR